jgi:hypothetical protein
MGVAGKQEQAVAELEHQHQARTVDCLVEADRRREVGVTNHLGGRL